MPESEQVVRETVCELANMVIGNSVTLLNDQGFRFKVFPPEIHMNEEGLAGNVDTEAMVLCVETPCGDDLSEYFRCIICIAGARTSRLRSTKFSSGPVRWQGAEFAPASPLFGK